jgi:hypothetical protein
LQFNVTVSHPAVAACHHRWARLTCDATHFHLETGPRVSENGAEIFRPDWQKSFARHHV